MIPAIQISPQSIHKQQFSPTPHLDSSPHGNGIQTSSHRMGYMTQQFDTKSYFQSITMHSHTLNPHSQHTHSHTSTHSMHFNQFTTQNSIFNPTIENHAIPNVQHQVFPHYRNKVTKSLNYPQISCNFDLGFAPSTNKHNSYSHEGINQK